MYMCQETGRLTCELKEDDVQDNMDYPYWDQVLFNSFKLKYKLL